jgi:hypothetical protein
MNSCPSSHAQQVFQASMLSIWHLESAKRHFRSLDGFDRLQILTHILFSALPMASRCAGGGALGCLA